MRNKFSDLLFILAILVAACARQTDLGIRERVKNKPQIDHAVSEWNRTENTTLVRNQALRSIMDCARDDHANVETRAYCVHELNTLSSKSDEALDEINGLILPDRVAKLSQIFGELEAAKSRSH